MSAAGNGASARPDVAQVLGRLKDFQRATVDHVFERMYLADAPAHRFLVADEVGLGKTLVARGVTARVLDHLWDRVERLDVVYICSNADIARQNVARLNVFGHNALSIATRLTLLPSELRTLRHQKVNFVSFTPGTSFDLKGSLGRSTERVLLHHLLREAWALGGAAAPRNVLAGFKSVQNFRAELEQFETERAEHVDHVLADAFVAELARRARQDAAVGRVTLRDRFGALCQRFARADSRVSDDDLRERNAVVGELRRVLAATCIRSLQPDLVILDEFQRFGNLLHGDDEAAQLAQELFAYGADHERTRVLLLSATPYKMYTVTDEARGEDHYRDFVQTLRFLLDDDEATRGVVARLGELRDALAGGTRDPERLAAIRVAIESVLRRVIVRTERLAASPDRSGMLREITPRTLSLAPSDALAYVAGQRMADALRQPDLVELWKSAPWLVSLMDEYQLKHRLKDALARDPMGGVAKVLRDGHRQALPAALPVDDVEHQRPLDVPHPRLRWLLEETVGCGAWQLLWVPPSMPYHRLDGPYAEPTLQRFTKRLVFSAWRVVPKAVAAVVSAEAERHMLACERRPGETRTGMLERISGPLRFGRTGGRLTGMTALALVYPSIALARLGDPLRLAADVNAPMGEADRSALLDACARRIDDRLGAIAPPAQTTGAADEAWYWAAPLLLDLAEDRAATLAWLERSALAPAWLGRDEADDEDGDHLWQAHVRRFREMTTPGGVAELGPRPADLPVVLAKLAMSGPGTCALRAIGRRGTDIAALAVRDAAGSIAHGFRGLFNLPEVVAAVRAGARDEAYWEQVLDHAGQGCLQAVLDEYLHVLREAEGLLDQTVTEVAPALALRSRDAIGARTSRLRVDRLTVAGNHRVSLEPASLRARFAMRFGFEQDADGGDGARAETVRTAFNSPFWPFVLASTSVGQEGLDFHQYCHAVVHWNIPGNPVDMEQREGRVHRYKGHAVRRNVARRQAATLQSYGVGDPWEAMFDAAHRERPEGSTDLVPYWVYPIEDGAVIERHVPNLPLSREVGRHARLRQSLAVYRMVMGQPRQEELIELLLAQDGATEEMLRATQIDLSPRPVADTSAMRPYHPPLRAVSTE